MIIFIENGNGVVIVITPCWTHIADFEAQGSSPDNSEVINDFGIGLEAINDQLTLTGNACTKQSITVNGATEVINYDTRVSTG